MCVASSQRGGLAIDPESLYEELATRGPPAACARRGRRAARTATVRSLRFSDGLERRENAPRNQRVSPDSHASRIEERVADRGDDRRQHFLARPAARLVDSLDDDRRDCRVFTEAEGLIRVPIEARHVRLVELHFLP